MSLINADANICLHHGMNLCRKSVVIPSKVIRKPEKVVAIFLSYYYCIIFNWEVHEEFGFPLISHLKSIYVKWSMIQNGET